VRLAVGLSDGISKFAAHALLEPVLATPSLHLVCHEGEVEQLLAELALHHLDLVLAGQPAPYNASLRLTSLRVLEAPVDWYGPSAMIRKSDLDEFPQSLGRLPLLLPTAHSSLRPRIDRWFESQGLAPRIVGEFEDSALLSHLRRLAAWACFPAPDRMRETLTQRYGVAWFADVDGVLEHFFAIGTERKVQHPLVKRLLGRG